MSDMPSIPVFNGRNFWVNCTASQIMSVLKHQGCPVEYLFFNSADKIQSILCFVREHIESVLHINETRIRTSYSPAFINHIEQLGIVVDIETPPSFESFHSQLVHRMKEGYSSLLTVQTYYVPHHTLFYQQRFASGGHSVIIGDYHPEHSEYDIYDDSKDLTHYIHFSYNVSVLGQAYDHSAKQAIFFRGPADHTHIDTEPFTHGFRQWLTEESGDISGFSSLEHFYAECPQKQLDLLILNNTLAIARGTRLLLADYLKTNACPAPILTRLYALTERMEEAELYTMKCVYSNKPLDQGRLAVDMKELERIEQEIIADLHTTMMR